MPVCQCDRCNEQTLRLFDASCLSTTYQHVCARCMLHMLFSISMRNDGNDDILTKTICRQCEKELDIPQECRMVPEEHDKHISPGSCDAHHAGNMRQDGK